MLGLGIDSVEIERFKNWPSYTKARLSKIFSPEEIEYCLSNPSKSLERFAGHFATKEAFFKAISPTLQTHKPFLTVCKIIQLSKNENSGAPKLKVDWTSLPISSCIALPISTFVSITHSKNIASAVVALTANNSL